MSIVKLHPSGQEIACEDNDTILGALEKAGYALPNNCRAGACGECRCKVTEGTFDQGMVMDMALSQADRAEGYGLMCMAKPTSDVVTIEYGTDDAQPKLFPPQENLHFTVVDRIQRTPRMIELHLLPLGKPMRFWPGQFVTLGDEANGIPARSYSICNAPNSDGEIVLLVTRVEDGITSNWVHDHLNIGTRTKLSGPYGTFIGDPSVETPVLCLAAGSGLAPLLSLSGAALRRGYKAPVQLLFSARTEEDIPQLGLLKHWQVKHRNFKFRPTLTRDKHSGLEGRITDLLPELYPDLSNHSIYIAGSPEFSAACEQAVLALGAEEKQIHTEGFFDQFIPEQPPQDRLV